MGSWRRSLGSGRDRKKLADEAWQSESKIYNRLGLFANGVGALSKQALRQSYKPDEYRLSSINYAY
jgi:hypothetical protein